eukprot:CAMPEP_0118944996 /NCGR_PEP_ID=MMETSP1169-20130426/41420_1 /TAXON_ID=36882 /ORGANISM="Pyramimonas obovata, Strain CCMP722" /LENGTH=208 /DNA_ID=CAMNT_0006890615 /DNA_START=101 /DNA_END=727 /DNA_ORIENTATION=-
MRLLSIRLNLDLHLRHHLEECCDKAALAKGLEKEVRRGGQHGHGCQAGQGPRHAGGVEPGEVAQRQLQAGEVALPQKEMQLQPHCVPMELHREGGRTHILVHYSGKGKGEHRCKDLHCKCTHTEPILVVVSLPCAAARSLCNYTSWCGALSRDGGRAKGVQEGAEAAAANKPVHHHVPAAGPKVVRAGREEEGVAESHHTLQPKYGGY